MAEKNWTDKLRQKMSEYTETPPGGLWEGIESAAGLGGKAAGGFWAWLTARPALWPVWATAGVAAAFAAVLLLRAPATPQEDPTTIIAQTDNTSGEPSSVIAQTDNNDDAPEVTEDLSSITDSSDVNSGDSSVSSTDSPVSSTGAQRISRQVRNNNEAADHTVVPNEGDVVSDNAVVASEEDKAKDNTVISSEGEAEVEKSPDTEAGQPGAKTEESLQNEPKKQDSGDKQPETLHNWAPNTPGTTTVPISRLKKRSKPGLVASLVGTNVPGGGTTITSDSYGFANPAGNYATSDINPKMAMIGRNKKVQNDASHRQDYQFGLLLGYSFNERWGLESGVTVTGLSSATTESTSSFTRARKETFTYIGVPLRVVFYPVRYNSFALYTSLGPAAEYGVYSAWESRDIMGDKEIASQSDSSHPGDWVFSASLNAGVQWQPWKYGAFFLQPGVVGRLVSESSPESYYTTHPISFQLAAGYKINF